MSTIIATTLSNGSVSVPTATVVNGSAKAWCDWNQTGTQAISDSFNVSSITDTGTGRTTVTYISAFSSVNYSVAGMCGTGGTNSGRIICVNNIPTATSSSYTCALATTVTDMPVTNIMAMGDLA